MAFPYKVTYVFEILIQVVSFDFNDPNEFIDFGFTETEGYDERFSWLGYESSNFYECLGSIVYFIVLLLLKLALVPVCFLFRKMKIIFCCKCCKNNCCSYSKDEFI